MIVITDPAGRSVSMRGDWKGMTPGDLIVDATTGLPGSAQVRGELVDRLGSGVWTPAVWRAGREITISCWAHFAGYSRDQRQILVARVARDLLGLWVDGSKLGQLRYRHAGEDLSCAVQPLPGVSWDVDTTLDYRGWLRAVVKLVAPDPCLYGTPRTVQAQSHSGEGAGLTWPLFGPVLSYGAPTAPPIVSANNRGNAPAYATAVVRGNAPAGFDLRIGSARVVWGYELSEGMAVEVDLRGAVTVAGVSQQAGVTLADWQPIAPGATATCSVEPASGDGACWAEITIRDTYL